ncbi:hypothetical protein Kpol_495p12 [Vanderwaltozyma polyspora DSM 70294]|uniref:Uncharacterized protein n=1 Tax=Vanderwaltozyma polyspora (strain ATCC 22028 / DSM 70294 / BCRC 21397 / CBS 2163 / NBRC 10782 / NRRL Y-8283 / UCD 57-17) TaxID=436907 RepID=A7TNY9_VANPO|nr:uncharacterized protein Kpol_495p12 [Vanderwaltozyma polyspora DSM 70294]EDO16014.1 hypothetical protein Kpol_495p12 [Vanderwaltozyma polyspora DSM 70294]
MSVTVQEQDKVLRNLYRRLKLYASDDDVNENSHLVVKPKLKPSVSFNTVPSYAGRSILDDNQEFEGVHFPTDYSMEEFYDNESGYATECNQDYFNKNHYMVDSASHRKRGSSPPPTPGGKLSASSLSQMFKIAENGKIVRVDYPSRPSISNDAVIVTRVQGNWEKLWSERKHQIEERILNKRKYFSKPDELFPEQKFVPIISDDLIPKTREQRKKDKILQLKVGYSNSPRTLVCHISGRRHTWVALDWMLRELSVDLDHIVVITNLPRLRTDKVRSRSREKSSSRSVSESKSRSCSRCPDAECEDLKDEDYDIFSKSSTENNEWCSGYDKQHIELEIKNIFNYIRKITPPEKILKITVELLVAKTSKMFCDIVNVYTPDFFVSSTLRWSQTDNLVVWKSKKITDSLCTCYPIPVFVVPAERMYHFETNLQNEFAIGNMDKLAKHLKVSSASTSTEELDEDDIETVLTANDEVKSVSLGQRLKDLAHENRTQMMDRLTALISGKTADDTSSSILENKFNIIFKESLKFAEEINKLKCEDESDTEFEQLKRVITGGAVRPVVSSKKSMLDVVDTTNKKAHHHHHHHHKDREIELSRTNSSQIKFASSVKVGDGNEALGNLGVCRTMSNVVEKSPSSPTSGLSLRPTMSYSISSSTNNEPIKKCTKKDKNNLRKTKSANNVEPVKSNDSSSSTGKKKGGFFSFFKRG